MTPQGMQDGRLRDAAWGGGNGCDRDAVCVGWMAPCTRGADDRSHAHGLGLRVNAETACTMQRLLQGRTPARREGGLAGPGLLVQERTVLAVTLGPPSAGIFGE